MRRLTQCVFLVLLMLGSLPGMRAQTHYEGQIYVGGKAGVTLSRVNFNPTVPQTMLPGMMVGGTFRYVEERHFGIIVELNVEQRGWKEKFDGYDYSYQRKLTYIQLPVMTHIYFGSHRFHGYFNAGPELGFMLASGTKSNFDYAHFESIEGFPSVNRSTDQFNMKIDKRFDYGISAGLGMEWFKDNHHSFTLEGRFYYGLNDVFNNHKTDVFSGSNSMSIMVTLGYNYRLK